MTKPKKLDGQDLVDALFAKIESSNVKLDTTHPVYDDCVDLDTPYPGDLPPPDALDSKGNMTPETAEKLQKDNQKSKR